MPWQVPLATPVRGILRLPNLAGTGSTTSEPRVELVNYADVCKDSLQAEEAILQIVENKHFIDFVLLRRLDDPSYKFDGSLEETQMFNNFATNRADMLQAMSSTMDAKTYAEVLETLSAPKMIRFSSIPELAIPKPQIRLEPEKPEGKQLEAELEKMIDEQLANEASNAGAPRWTKEEVKETLFEILKRKDTVDLGGAAQHAPPGTKGGGKGAAPAAEAVAGNDDDENADEAEAQFFQHFR